MCIYIYIYIYSIHRTPARRLEGARGGLVGDALATMARRVVAGYPTQVRLQLCSRSHQASMEATSNAMPSLFVGS